MCTITYLQRLLRGLFLLVGTSLATENSFITTAEYGKELYNNPRNISCAKCHGALGTEQVITSYTQDNQQHSIKAPPINNLEFEAFKKALTNGKSIMPKYNLTPDEIKAIYYYLASTRENKP
ncbi:c-type cytochrome [Helicobacter mehlei]|uniref:c-type cytochrome n=1 Tax=Helicobacter mehlei TaxID=2316080 RepID=UPI00163D870F|nr:cytochrome c [Helicobacter mehlei]